MHQTIRNLSVAALLSTCLSASAQTYYSKADNNDALSLGTSWTNGVAPASTATDVALWDSTVATAANCSNTVAATLNWGGIQVLNPAAAVKVTSSSTLNLGEFGIDLNQAGTSQDFWLAMGLATAADQTWLVKSGRTLTLGDASRNINIQNIVTPLGHVSYVNTLQVQNGGTLNITNGTVLDPSPAAVTGATLNIGNNSAGACAVNQSGGSLTLKRSSGTSGSPAASLSIASASSSLATYTITNGSIIDASPADTAWIVVGAGSSAQGTLNIDGTASLQLVKVLLGNSAGAVGVINLTNGTVNVASTVFDVGRSSGGANGFVNVYGGALSFAGSMNLGRGPGNGVLNVYAGTVNLSGLNVSGANTGAGPGTNLINGGTVTITNSLTLAANGSIGNAEVDLNSGTLTVGSVTRGTGSGSYVAFNLNGGMLKARANGTLIATAVPTYVLAGGATIDTAGFNVTAAAPLLDGTGGGGLTKLSAGRLTLSGTNTYTGATLVSAGQLYLNTTIHPGGPITVNDSALLRTTLSATGTTLPCSSLTLGTSTGVSAEFDLGTNVNATVPLVHATNLTAKGTISVSVFGTAMSQGTIPLIQYDGTVSGGGTFTLSFVQGWSGFVTNNTAAKQIQLVITSAKSLAWRASVNTNWDVATANWFDLSNSVAATFTGGASTYFDDSTSNGLVYVTTAVTPGAMTLSNTSSNYTFTGVGQISGVGGLTKTGSGMVTMSVSNTYSGITSISNGVFRLGTNNAIPGSVNLEARLEMGGFNNNIGNLNGAAGTVDNTSNAAVVLGVTGGSFGGVITNRAGALLLAKSGGGTLSLLSANGYSGGTSNNGGTLLVANEGSIGSGPFIFSGAILGWLDAGAHVLTNKTILAGGATFGTPGNGPLTIPNTADFAAGGRAVTAVSDVSLPNGFTNGWLSGKGGSGNLTIRNSVSHNPAAGGSGTIVIGSAVTTLDNVALTQENGNVRLRAGNDGETCRFVITNGSSFLMTNTASQNFRFNDGGSADNTINILDLAGPLTITPYPGGNSKVQMGSSTDLGGQNIINLLPNGLLRVKQILDQGPNSSSIFNFDGGTLSPNTNDFANSFMQFLDQCYVLDRGAFVDTAGWDITIGQTIQAGGSGTGGLKKLGAGTLYLNGGNSYGGATEVAVGRLSGSGSLTTPVHVASGASIGAGTSGSIGTLNINSSLNLSNASSAFMRINSDSLTSDTISGVTSLGYAGTLIVTNTGASAFTSGQVFTLFSASSYGGSFASYVLPALSAGLTWDTSKLGVDGTISIGSAPAFSSIVYSGGSVILSGAGGSPGGTYYLLGSTNVTQPLSTWTRISTNSFDGSGNFSVTNAVNPSTPKQFFSIGL